MPMQETSPQPSKAEQLSSHEERVAAACGVKALSANAECGLEVLRREVTVMYSKDQDIARIAGRFNVCGVNTDAGLCPYTAVVQTDGVVAIDQRPPVRRWSRRSF